MIKVNRYEDINNIENEAKKDYIDRHSPFVHCEKSAKAGDVFQVTVKMGEEYTHPDDLDHHIATIALYNGQTKLAESNFFAGALGGQGKKGHQTITFNIVLEKNAKLTAQSYCTKHGLWESGVIAVEVK
ncbi:MAG: class II SORL domain-containing protein [Bacteriovoracaceae bacterium]|nr:class II SORL domain-containing protein [Bacteriovoracaceae bacterium]